jgi:hypothetical protein
LSGGAKLVVQVKAKEIKEVKILAVDKKKGLRVYQALESDSDKVLKVELPPLCACWTDPKNGRWRLKYQDGPQRSISWTNIGQQVASLIAIKQGWEWAETFSGAKLPPHLNALLTERGLM